MRCHKSLEGIYPGYIHSQCWGMPASFLPSSEQWISFLLHFEHWATLLFARTFLHVTKVFFVKPKQEQSGYQLLSFVPCEPYFHLVSKYSSLIYFANVIKIYFWKFTTWYFSYVHQESHSFLWKLSCTVSSVSLSQRVTQHITNLRSWGWYLKLILATKNCVSSSYTWRLWYFSLWVWWH